MKVCSWNDISSKRCPTTRVRFRRSDERDFGLTGPIKGTQISLRQSVWKTWGSSCYNAKLGVASIIKVVFIPTAERDNATVPWDFQGIIFVGSLEKGRTIPVAYCASLLDHSKFQIQEKRLRLAHMNFFSITTTHQFILYSCAHEIDGTIFPNC